MLVLSTFHHLKTMKILKKIREDHHFMIDEISKETGMSWSSSQQILTEDLQMRCVAGKFIPHLR